MKAAGIVLAAGASRRFGSPKQLALVDGEQLLAHAVRICSEAALSPILVVLGANADQIEAGCDLRDAHTIRNPAWERGMASSIAVGIRALAVHEVDAAVIMTCDMPLVTADHLRSLVVQAGKKRTNVASRGRNWTGVPACFVAASFPELLSLAGTAGARSLLKRAATKRLPACVDVDTLEDLEAVRQLL